MAVPPPLSAVVEGSFAYLTVRDRLPTYLTKVIDHLCQEKSNIASKYGQESSKEIKEIIGKLSEVKNRMQTNKPILPIHLEMDTRHGDAQLWNEDIEAFTLEKGDYPKWFTASWLFVECFLYKRIHEIFQASKTFHSYDPFWYQKVDALEGSLEGLKSICIFTFDAVHHLQDNEDWLRENSSIFFQLSLWGNQCDLSHPNMDYKQESTNLVTSLTSLTSNILHSDMSELFQHLQDVPPKKRHVGMVLDNAGFELVADLFLMTFLLESKLVTNFSIYPKTRPYFISDTTAKDFHYTLERLRKEGGHWEDFYKMWSRYLQDGRWVIKENNFWTTSRVYSTMHERHPALYEDLSRHCLLIFKGDLNYRKLVSDLDWPHDTPVKTALMGFLPCPLMTLRTIKGGPVVGIDTQSSNYLRAKEVSKWDASGNYGLLQFVSSL